MVANTFHHEDSMAEFVVAATIVLRRGILTQDAAMRKGVWASPGYNRMALSSTLQDAEIGFVGFGHIGATVWERFRAFGARGSAITRRGDVDAAAHGLERTGTVADLPAVLESADVVVVSAPLTPETTGLIGAAELARMRGSALLVNVGRGPIIEQGALYAALRDRTIAGAAIDVWYDYPGADGIGYPSVQPFHELDNVIMSPHSSAQTRQTFQQRAVEIAANIGRHAAGEPLVNLVAVVPAEQDVPAR
jgi:phosphoglycerate dehydrogenase-like enzyme